MKTVQFDINDPRLKLFADNHTFIAGTDPQHIEQTEGVLFAGQLIAPGVVFNALGRNVLHDGYKYLEANSDNYYQFKGVMQNVTLPGFSQPMTLMLFSAFSISGPDEQMHAFAKEHDFNSAYFALAYDEKTRSLSFLDSAHAIQRYAGAINIVNDDGSFVLVDNL